MREAAMEDLIVEALVPVGTRAYRECTDEESLFAMVIPLASAQDKPLAAEQIRFLMAHHCERDTWELPSGKVERGESSAQAAQRELLEETGARVGRLRSVGILLTRLGQVPGQGHLYWGQVVQRGDLPGGSEMDEVRAFSLDMLPPTDRMGPVTRWVVRWMGCRPIATTLRK
jgi:8-oxo-dGTP pyrophosphatase MutT (NUDIX family)